MGPTRVVPLEGNGRNRGDRCGRWRWSKRAEAPLLEADRGAAFLQVNLGDDPPAEELKRELDAAFHPAENEIAEDPIGC